MHHQATKVCILAMVVATLWTTADAQGQSQFVAQAPPPAPPPGKGCRSSFTVRKAETGRLSAGDTIRFQDVITNSGGWEQSTNSFRAPCDGVYFFTFHAVSTERGDFTVALNKNRQYQVTAYGSKGDYQQGSNSAVLYLNRGDDVHLELEQGSIYEHPFDEAYTTFTGFLVDPY